MTPLAGQGAYLGRSVDLGWGRVYGGQTMAQGLAACQQLAPGRSVHHVSCNFLRAGRVDQDIRFEAEALTSGQSFTAVHCRAMQEAKAILVMTASLQAPELGMEHQTQAGLRPEWRRPEELRSFDEHMSQYLDRVPQRMRAIYGPQPIEIRPAEFVLPWDATPRPPCRAVWVRMRLRAARRPAGARARSHVHLRLGSSRHEPAAPPDGDRHAGDADGLALAQRPLPPTVSARASLLSTSPSRLARCCARVTCTRARRRLDRQWLCHAMHSPVSLFTVVSAL